MSHPLTPIPKQMMILYPFNRHQTILLGQYPLSLLNAKPKIYYLRHPPL